MGDYKDAINPHTGNLQRLLNSDTVDEFRTNINNIFDELMNNAMEIEEVSTGVTLDMINGFRDSYEDESGIDTINSENQQYDSVNDYYTPTGGIGSNTKLLLHCDGEDESTTFTDSSNYEHTVTAHGTAQIDTAKSKFGGASGLLDGNSDYLTVADSEDWQFGSGDFTVDFWINWNDYSISNWRGFIGHGIAFAQSNLAGNWAIAHQANTGKLLFLFNSQSTPSYASDAFSFTEGVWTHIACVRDGNTLRWFQDGVAKGTNDITGMDINTNSYPLTIGQIRVGGGGGVLYYLGANLDEIRVSKGIARWTEAFTPPTSAYSALKDNMTLISETFSVDTAPSNARMLFKVEYVDDITLDTDLKFYLSRDGDTNRTQGTSEVVRTIGSNKMIGVDFDLSSQPSDTDLIYRVVTANNKDLYLKGTVCQIKA